MQLLALIEEVIVFKRGQVLGLGEQQQCQGSGPGVEVGVGERA